MTLLKPSRAKAAGFAAKVEGRGCRKKNQPGCSHEKQLVLKHNDDPKSGVRGQKLRAPFHFLAHESSPVIPIGYYKLVSWTTMGLEDSRIFEQPAMVHSTHLVLDAECLYLRRRP